MNILSPEQLKARIVQSGDYWNNGADPDVIDSFPAQELSVTIPENEPRKWPETWLQAGGGLFDDRMIALKSNPVWQRISAFGLPFPPFDRCDALDVQDVDRTEAESLGLLKASDKVFVAQRNIAQDVEAVMKQVR